MEADIEIRLPAFPVRIAVDMEKIFIIDYKNKEDDETDVVVRASAEPLVVGGLDIIVVEFLKKIAVYSKEIRECLGLLRIGIFYYLSETVVFPFCLSADSVKLISDLGLAIDVTGYPCSDAVDEGS